jgi:superfamily I DNA/RNA helicase
MHASKGLEFKLVFVVGAEEGLCPYFAPGEEPAPARLAEERRLFYVALTRAKDRLYLTRAQNRRLYGQALPGQPSPFLALLPPTLCLDLSPKLTASPRQNPQPRLFD